MQQDHERASMCALSNAAEYIHRVYFCRVTKNTNNYVYRYFNFVSVVGQPDFLLLKTLSLLLLRQIHQELNKVDFNQLYNIQQQLSKYNHNA